MSEYRSVGEYYRSQVDVFDDPDALDSPYCECDCEPDEEECASLRCKSCGKEICP